MRRRSFARQAEMLYNLFRNRRAGSKNGKKQNPARTEREGARKMDDTLNRSYDFTMKAWDRMYETVDHQYFREMDAELIYRSLEKELKPVPFGDYLKRYIYRKAEMQGSFREIPLKDYQMIIMDAFREHHTPPSFTPTTAKLSALSKNWLTQQTVKRQVVLLLGFGLGMSDTDVNEFLYKALHEPELQMMDPMETICCYCYQHGYDYYKFEQLMKIYGQTKPDELNMKLIYEGQPAGRTASIQAVQDDAKLMSYLATLKTTDGSSHMADAAWNMFRTLYDRAREVVAEAYNAESAEENEQYVRELTDRLNRSDRWYDEEKQEKIRRAEGAKKHWTKEDITESDLEHVLCSAIPVDRNGNLTPARRSTLNAQFEGKRFSRKHINEILLRHSRVERFDLITMNFLIFAGQTDRIPNEKERYSRFIDGTNRILSDCGMGPLYVTNPYECFVLMCILSVSPLETYADVMEISYGGEETGR